MNNTRPVAGLTPAVKILLIINVAVFFLSYIAEGKGIKMTELLGMHITSSEYFRPWQYVTYMFMHGGIEHIFFNMFALFMFGRILENVWGTRRFLIYYFVCGIGAAVVNSLIGLWEYSNMMHQYEAFCNTPEPELFSEFINSHISHANDWVYKFIDEWINNPSNPELIENGKMIFTRAIQDVANVPMVGASGAIFGILLAFGILFPNSEMYLMFIPIPIKAKYFVFGYGVLELVLGLQNNIGDNVAHFAHLGGMIFGFIMLMMWRKNRRNFY